MPITPDWTARTSLTRRKHLWLNRTQTGLLILALLGIFSATGGLIFGTDGVWLALGACLFALLLAPATATPLTLHLYRARPIAPAEAPQLWAITRELAARAGLPSVPVPHYVPSSLVNAFATGSQRRSAIALTDGLLRSLDPRELAGVLGHEIAHIANDDLRVMGLADYVSRLTGVIATFGQVLILVSLPLVLTGMVAVDWLGLLLLALAPHLALLAQLGLSRVREFDADRLAAELTGDPPGLASALAKIERIGRSWKAWLLPGWGNPEPSWLRTHPATSDRIARLLEMAHAGTLPYPVMIPSLFSPPVIPPRTPRWFLGGFWH